MHYEKDCPLRGHPPCQECSGEGYVRGHRCRSCYGTGHVFHEDVISERTDASVERNYEYEKASGGAR